MSVKVKLRRSLVGEVTFAALPGPTRKRKPSPYCFRLVHRSADQSAAGCALLWDVLGGREVYQVALERLESGQLRWHCTCPDATFRGEGRPHTCKHVRGLLALGRGRELTLGEDSLAAGSASS